MTVLIPTTTVRIVRPDGVVDPYEPNTETNVASGVPAHLSAPGGTDIAIGGDKEVVTAVALLPAGTDVARYDDIVDERTSERYFVAWTRARFGLGLNHVKVGLRAVKGGASG